MAFEYLAQHTTFESVADMDTAVEEHIEAHYYDLTESERAIVFKLASHSLEYPGACHLKAATIAAALEISTKTVYRAISKLESLGIIKRQKTTKVKGGRGANIYIILPYKLDACESYNKPLEECKVAPLQEVNNRAHAEKEAHKEFMNEYQQMLYDFMQSLPLSDNVKVDLHRVVLASNVSNIQEFILAKNIIFKIANDIKEGVLKVTKTIRAIFVGAHKKALQRRDRHTSLIVQKHVNERPVPFYNWITNRDGPTAF
ncbi:helix-turn-helix domain-containing protein [Lysinibacillus capsici]|uniref:helix-turn-helix domain-containing protein n=1 Tax=Lysinibacillus capsici TaxID=2115968 RepID=UPI002A7F29F8|nr:helix-turn-helix domain-containing protein [Lysinibacillus capsici]